RAVDRHERTTGARAGFVNRLRDQLFTGTALAGYQNRRASGGDLFDQAKNFLHHIGAPDDLTAIDGLTHRASQCAALFFFAASFNARADLRCDLFVLERLSDAAKSAAFPGGDGGVESRVSGDHEDYRVGIHLQKLFERAQSTDAWHRHVEQHHVIRAAAVSFKAFFTGLREIYAIAFVAEERLEHLAHDLLVIDDED